RPSTCSTGSSSPFPCRSGARKANPAVLTSTGKTFAVLAVLLTATGWLMHYAALLALGLACIVALAAATIWVVRRPRVRAVRELQPERITVGQRALSELRITNLGRRRTASG